MQATDSHANGTTKAAPLPDTSAPDEFAAASARLRTEIDLTLTALKRAWYIEKQALGLTVFDIGLRVVVAASLAIAAITVIVCAALLTISAGRRGLALLFHDAWWTDFVLALVIGSLAAAAVPLIRGAVHRSVLSRTKRKLAKSGSEAAVQPSR